MVLKTSDHEHGHRFILRPNQSLTWRQASIVFGALAVVCLAIAAVFTLNGFWPVLPFAGAELLAVGAGMYVCMLRGTSSEVVSVGERQIAIEKGRRHPEQRWEMPRAWAGVALLRPAVKWYPTRLVLRSHGREVELGTFLTEDERQQLAGELRRAIAN